MRDFVEQALEDIKAGHDVDVSIQQDMIPIASFGDRPDEQWSFIDAKGHRHTWGTQDKTWQSVTVEKAEYWCCDCGDFHDDSSFEMRCIECDEEIHPGTKSAPPYREYLKGLKEATINGVPCTEAEVQIVIKAMKAAKR